jgi:hypothetical protein
MHSRIHSHDHLFGTRWTPATIALTLAVSLLFLILLLLFLNLTAVPAQAQYSCPPSMAQPATAEDLQVRSGSSRHEQWPVVSSQV